MMYVCTETSGQRARLVRVQSQLESEESTGARDSTGGEGMSAGIDCEVARAAEMNR